MRICLWLLSLIVPLSAVFAEDLAPARARVPSFNPDISLILAGGAAHLSNDPARYAIPGFMLGAETGPGERGLSLAESELVMSANVDDLFYGQFTAALSPQTGRTPSFTRWARSG